LENIVSPNNSLDKYKESQTPLQKAGSFIKEARQGRSISIEELSEDLRIGKEQLVALENGQEELLPERVFVKAMIRRVSEKLNIDTSFILQELQGREVSVKKLYDSNSIKSEKITINKITPLIIITSGALGIISSFIAINYIKDSLSISNPEGTSSSTHLLKDRILEKTIYKT
tara:strand:- start:136 stop:654 length:519 start_codon:yes stop_codon:yes gene_type:complete